MERKRPETCLERKSPANRSSFRFLGIFSFYGIYNESIWHIRRLIQQFRRIELSMSHYTLNHFIFGCFRLWMGMNSFVMCFGWNSSVGTVETTECNRSDFEIFFENLSVGFGCNCLDYNRMQPKSKIHNRRVFLGCIPRLLDSVERNEVKHQLNGWSWNSC